MTTSKDFDEPVNLAGQGYYEIESVEVAQFHPEPDGKGRPTQVHVMMTISELDFPLTMRIKSKVACEQLIFALMEHSKEVWP